MFRYAIATGRARRDIAADLIEALAPRTTQRHEAIADPGKVGEPLTATTVSQLLAARKLAPFVFVRPTELRAAEQSEIMLDGGQPERRIPAERMKMREAQIVPLGRRAVNILRALQPITGRQQCAFPAIGGGGHPLSENILNGGIRRLGCLQPGTTII